MSYLRNIYLYNVPAALYIHIYIAEEAAVVNK